MCSALQDSVRGFGIPLTPAELESFNAWRRNQDRELGRPERPPLLESPGLRFLVYGKEKTTDKAGKEKKTGKQGSWNGDKMCEQIEDVLDLFDFLPEYQGKQLILQIDWSSGHSKKQEGGLSVTALNWGWGGDQGPAMHDSKLTAEDIGTEPSLIKDGDGVRDYGLNEGDTQQFQFGTGVEGEVAPDPPLTWPSTGLPYLNPSLPPHDAVDADGKVTKPGWMGKPKGVRQILFEARMLKKKMMHKLHKVDKTTKKDPSGRTLDLCASTALRQRRDFRTEMSEMERLVAARGHILVMSPKCHPELGCDES